MYAATVDTTDSKVRVKAEVGGAREFSGVLEQREGANGACISERLRLRTDDYGTRDSNGHVRRNIQKLQPLRNKIEFGGMQTILSGGSG